MVEKEGGHAKPEDSAAKRARKDAMSRPDTAVRYLFSKKYRNDLKSQKAAEAAQGVGAGEEEVYTGLFGMQGPPGYNKKTPAETLRAQVSEAGQMVTPYAERAAALVGYDRIMEEIRDAVQYHIIKDTGFIQARGAAVPPQIFIIKGSSGMGKTALVNAAMYEAWQMGKESGVAVYSKTPEVSKFSNKMYGESEKQTEVIFDDSFKRPTVLFIDEAQAVLNKGANPDLNEGNTDAPARTRDMIIQKINQMADFKKPCVLILATDDFEILPDPIKRRAAGGTFDLNLELTRNDLVEITRRALERHSMSYLPAAGVLDAVEMSIKGEGHSHLTPADVTTAVNKVDRGNRKPIRASEFRKLAKGEAAKREQEVPKVTLDDFRKLKGLREYDESRKSKDISRMISKIKPTLTLDDVGGQSPMKEDMLTDVELALDPENTKQAGASPIRGIMLYGPPGTGKTYVAKAVAGEVNATVYEVSGSEIMKPYYGQSDKLIRDLFADARKNAPSMIIFDEIDAITADRASLGGSDGRHTVITTLLSEMDGLNPKDGVVVIGTTNILDSVDPAFKRPGRFDRLLHVDLPKSDAEALEVINVHMRKCMGILDPSATNESVLALFNKRTFSPARIKRVVSDAAQLRLKELNAIRRITNLGGNNQQGLENAMKKYGGDFKRACDNLGIPLKDRATEKDLTPEVYEALRHVDPNKYHITMAHFRTALDMMKDEMFDEIRGVTAALRGNAPKPEVGKVYGLSVLSDNGGGAGTEGMVSIIECKGDPGAGRGAANVVGSEIAKSIKESAEGARVFINEQSGWAMRHHEFTLDFVTAMKGVDREMIAGPSAGAAMALALYSRATNTEVLPNVVVTGGITINGEILKVGGLDHKGMGKMVAAIETEGVDTIVIPKANYDGLSAEDIESFSKHNLKVVPASTFWDVAKAALVGNPGEQQAKEALKNFEKLKQYQRTEGRDAAQPQAEQ